MVTPGRWTVTAVIPAGGSHGGGARKDLWRDRSSYARHIARIGAAGVLLTVRWWCYAGLVWVRPVNISPLAAVATPI